MSENDRPDDRRGHYRIVVPLLETMNEMIYEMNHILNCGYEIKWGYNPYQLFNIWFISLYIISFIDSFTTVTFESTHDQLPTSVASQLRWLERPTGIAKSRVQIPLNYLIFLASSQLLGNDEQWHCFRNSCWCPQRLWQLETVYKERLTDNSQLMKLLGWLLRKRRCWPRRTSLRPWNKLWSNTYAETSVNGPKQSDNRSGSVILVAVVVVVPKTRIVTLEGKRLPKVRNRRCSHLVKKRKTPVPKRLRPRLPQLRNDCVFYPSSLPPRKRRRWPSRCIRVNCLFSRDANHPNPFRKRPERSVVFVRPNWINYDTRPVRCKGQGLLKWRRRSHVSVINVKRKDDWTSKRCWPKRGSNFIGQDISTWDRACI